MQTFLTRAAAVVLVMAFCQGPGARAAAPPPQSQPTLRDNAAARRGRAEAALGRRLRQLNYNGTALDAFARVAKELATTVEPKWELLEAAGITKDHPVTLKFANVRGSAALAAILKQAGGDTELCCYADDRGTIVVTTRADYVSRETVDRRYDVTDLMRGPKATPQKPGQVVVLIKDTVDPKSWDTAGGTPGKIKYENGEKKVTQTRQAHRAIELLLDQLRQTEGLPVPKPKS